MNRRVLVAGVGNIFLADDGFGVEVARRLASEPLPDGVRVADYGIRGVHLAYDLLDGYDTLVLIDAVRRGESPGTVSLVLPEVEVEAEPESPPLDAHGLDPATVLRSVVKLGGSLGRVLLVACEPAELEERIGLSPRVEAAVEDALRLVREVLEEKTGCFQANGRGPHDREAKGETTVWRPSEP